MKKHFLNHSLRQVLLSCEKQTKTPQRRKLQTNITLEWKCKILQKILADQVQQHIKNKHHGQGNLSQAYELCLASINQYNRSY